MLHLSCAYVFNFFYACYMAHESCLHPPGHATDIGEYQRKTQDTGSVNMPQDLIQDNPRDTYGIVKE
jgi:hypothetical protein